MSPTLTSDDAATLTLNDRQHPCQRVRPSASYFAAGHRLLDSLTRPLPVRVAVQQRPDQDNRRAAVSSDGPAPSRP